MRQHGSGGLWALVSWVPTGRPVHTGGRLPWVILGALGYGVVAGCLAPGDSGRGALPAGCRAGGGGLAGGLGCRWMIPSWALHCP